jgi:uncharacterized membrane protein
MIKIIQTSILDFFRNKKVFWFLFLFYFVGLLLEMFYRNYFFEITVHDLGYQAQEIFNWVFNSTYYNSFEDMHPIANHFRPGMLILSPFIRILPTPIWLLFFKILAFLSCALILLHYGKKYLVDIRYAYTLPTMWLLNDIVSNTLHFQNVSTGIIIPFIMASFFFAYEKKHLLMYLCLAFILLFKENMALVWLSVGAFKFIIMKAYLHGIFLFFSGIIIGLSVHLGIMPLFNDGNFSKHHDSLAPFSYIPLKILMFIKVFLSTGLMLSIYPIVLLFVLPAFGLYVIGGNLSFFYINAHHHDFTITIVFVGLFFTLKHFLEGDTWFNKINLAKQKKLVATALFLLLLIGFATGMPYATILRPFYRGGSYIEQYKLSREAITIYDKIQKDITVFACKATGTYLVKHPHIMHIEKSTYTHFETKNSKPFYIIYPKNKRYVNMNNNTYYQINKLIEKGIKEGKYLRYEDFQYFNVVLVQ